MISIECPTCFKTYNVKPELRGKRLVCKGCGTRILVDEPGSRGFPDEDVSGSREASVGEPAVAGAFADIPSMPVETKQCPHCGSWLKSSATVCHYCDRRTRAENRPGGNENVRGQSERIEAYGRPAIAIAILVLDALVLMAWAAK